MMGPGTETLAGLYRKLQSERSDFLERAYDCAALTLPHLLLREGDQGSTLPTPYQSQGARGIASLSSKILMALFPTSHSFLRFQTDPFSLRQLAEDQASEVKQTLSEIETTVMSEIESQALRPQLHESIKQLLVAGNCLIHLPEGGGAKVHKLDSYCVKRDPEGTITHIVIKERISPHLLPEEVQVEHIGEPSDMVEDLSLIHI